MGVRFSASGAPAGGAFQYLEFAPQDIKSAFEGYDTGSIEMGLEAELMLELIEGLASNNRP